LAKPYNLLTTTKLGREIILGIKILVEGYLVNFLLVLQLSDPKEYEGGELQILNSEKPTSKKTGAYNRIPRVDVASSHPGD
jgi:hypothetical protein